MGTLKQVKHVIKYKVPAGAYCNLIDPLTYEYTLTKCRFCVGNNTKGHTCLLHNTPLGMADRNLVTKASSCARPSLFNKMEVIDVPDQALSNEPMVDPTEIMKLAIESYIKVKNQLEAQGFPSDMATKLAKKLILKGGKNGN